MEAKASRLPGCVTSARRGFKQTLICSPSKPDTIGFLSLVQQLNSLAESLFLLVLEYYNDKVILCLNLKDSVKTKEYQYSQFEN